MEEILDLLIEVQRADDEIKDTQSAIQRIPQKTEVLEKEIHDAQATLRDCQSRIQEIRKEYKLKEGDIAENESKITKLNTQTFAVKTNEEYRAIMSEIEFCKSENRKIEDTMMGLLEEEETLKTSIDKLETETAEYIAIRKEKLQHLQDEKERLSSELDKIKAAFDNNFAKLPEHIQEVYEKIKRVRGNAVCLIKDETCTGCSSVLTPQLFNELKKRDELITCDNCGRILIFTPSE